MLSMPVPRNVQSKISMLAVSSYVGCQRSVSGRMRDP